MSDNVVTLTISEKEDEEESSPRREAGVGVAWRPWRRAGVGGEEEAGVEGGVEGLA